jgi:hypothetical protein
VFVGPWKALFAWRVSDTCFQSCAVAPFHVSGTQETAAAVKVQAAYRRTLVMNRLEEEGCSTSAIRNRARRRQYTLAREAHTVSLFGCCAGPDFSWTDFGNPYDAQREYDKAAYEDKKKAQLEREEELRSTFGQRLRRKKEANKVDEAYEVVE